MTSTALALIHADWRRLRDAGLTAEGAAEKVTDTMPAARQEPRHDD